MPERRRLDVIEYAAWRQGAAFAEGLLPGQGQPADYQSLNMQVYSNGALGPRPYLKRLRNVGSGDNMVIAATGAGDSAHVDGFNKNVVIGGAYVRGFDSPSTPTGTWAPGSGSVPLVWPRGAFGYMDGVGRVHFCKVGYDVVWNGTTYASGGTNGSTITYPANNAHMAVLFKDRLFSIGTFNLPVYNRVFYSNPGALTTFGASSFFDVGYAQLRGIYALRDAILMYNTQGQWFAYSGNSPATSTLREVARGRIPDHVNHGVVWDNAVWFLGSDGQGVTRVTPEGIDTVTFGKVKGNIDFPVSYFLGASGLSDPEYTGLFGNKRALAFDKAPGLVLPYVNVAATTPGVQGLQSLDYVNGSFAHQAYWVATRNGGIGHGALQMDSPMQANQLYVYDAFEWLGRLCFLVSESEMTNKSTDATSIYARDLFLDRPSNSNDLFSGKYEELAGVYNNAGDSGTNMANGEVWLRIYAPPPGNRVRVSKILADVTYWDGSDYQDPTITAQILNENGSLYSTAHTSVEHTLTNTNTGDAGVPGRIEWYPGPLPASEYMQVRLTNIVGVALRKVVVEYEVLPE